MKIFCNTIDCGSMKILPHEKYMLYSSVYVWWCGQTVGGAWILEKVQILVKTLKFWHFQGEGPVQSKFLSILCRFWPCPFWDSKIIDPRLPYLKFSVHCQYPIQLSYYISLPLQYYHWQQTIFLYKSLRSAVCSDPWLVAPSQEVVSVMTSPQTPVAPTRALSQPDMVLGLSLM